MTIYCKNQQALPALHSPSIPTRCLPSLSHGEDSVSKACDKYPQKQGLVLSAFIHIKSQAAIGEPVGKSEQDADAGDIPTNAVSITSSDVTRQRMLEAVI
ncbi:hypothetical protein ABVT39_004119 [Epinephelus coioides]